MGGSVLAVVVDAHPYSWGSRRADVASGPALQFGDLLDDLTILLNGFVLLDPTNQPIVIASHPRHSSVLYPPPDPNPAAPRTDAAPRAAGPAITDSQSLAAAAAAAADGASGGELVPTDIGGHIRAGVAALLQPVPVPALLALRLA